MVVTVTIVYNARGSAGGVQLIANVNFCQLFCQFASFFATFFSTFLELVRVGMLGFPIPAIVDRRFPNVSFYHSHRRFSIPNYPPIFYLFKNPRSRLPVVASWLPTGNWQLATGNWQPELCSQIHLQWHN